MLIAQWLSLLAIVTFISNKADKLEVNFFPLLVCLIYFPYKKWFHGVDHHPSHFTCLPLIKMNRYEEKSLTFLSTELVQVNDTVGLSGYLLISVIFCNFVAIAEYTIITIYHRQRGQPGGGVKAWPKISHPWNVIACISGCPRTWKLLLNQTQYTIYS